jgi:arylsulfatase A-like enzyme
MSRARGRLRRARLTTVLAVAALVSVLVGLVACDSGSRLDPPAGAAPTGPGATPSRPNVVFVLADDLSWNLVPFMPHVRALQQAGMTFTNYTVTDSLCCPSRASIFTGDFPHDTHVTTNGLPNGGYQKFRAERDGRSTFATSLSAAGYRTGFMGKYLNDYEPAPPRRSLLQTLMGPEVPPGWSQWNGVGSRGYNGYDYAMAEGHHLSYHGSTPDDFLNTVMQRRGVAFIRSAASRRTPFLLEAASYTPHLPYATAPQDVGTFPGVGEPRTPAFGRLPRPAPAWLGGHRPMNPGATRFVDRSFERRVEAVQSLDRLVAALWSAVRDAGQAANTVFVFSSDNGYHMGEYTLRQGKQTAFDTDIRVPLIVAGPGIAPNSTNADVTENIDLRPTFDQLAGADTPADVDGRSLVPLLHGEQPPWRTIAGIEHTRPPTKRGDPDAQNGLQGVPPSYQAIRSPDWVYVRYVDGTREYYDLADDPYELHNLGPSLPAERVQQLDAMLDRVVTCHGSVSCWQAALPQQG